LDFSAYGEVVVDELTRAPKYTTVVEDSADSRRIRSKMGGVSSDTSHKIAI
jgi:hypothetical protein